MTLNNKETYPDICFQILKELKAKLAPHLKYHSYNHIIDVANVCNNYIRTYRIDDDMAKLIRIAAISHDFGYTISPINHEEQSIKLIEPMLKPVLTNDEIALISSMIRATKIPQDPKNFYDKILADADLDYLGRKDYDELSESLRQEFLHYGVVHTEQEWLDLQIKFFKSHSYHTLFAKWNREHLKSRKLKELIAKKT